MVAVETTEGCVELRDILGLGFDVMGEEAEWLLCCLGKKEEVALVLFGDVSESLLVSVFEVED